MPAGLSGPAWPALFVLSGLGSRIGPKPWARSQEACWGPSPVWIMGSPSVKEGQGWGPGGLQGPFLLSGRGSLGRLTGGGEQGGRGLGIEMRGRLALPSLVWATYLVSDLPENSLSGRAPPSVPGRELTGSGGRWPPGCVLCPQAWPNLCSPVWTEGLWSVPPDKSQEKVGDLELPVRRLRIRRARAYKVAGTA